MTIVVPCNNTSVGILVQRADRLLLIERRWPPYGWAPPAGHVDDGETYAQSAVRELREEVGLAARHLTLVHRSRYGNRCRRPGGDWHFQEVYDAVFTGNPVRSEDETCGMRWVTRPELDELVAVTEDHLATRACSEEWLRRPGLEPVWLEMLRAIGSV